MLHHEWLKTDGILILTPEGPLDKSDFEQLAREVDPYIQDKGDLRGLMIQAQSFPGWSNFESLLAHFKFVKNHHQHVTKVAAVTNDGFLSILPAIAQHFVHADVRHFDLADREKALHWLRSPRP